MVERMRTIRAVLSECTGVFVDHFPPGMLGKARAVCRVPADETVIAIVDCAVLGSAHVVVFGGRALYIHDRWTVDCPSGVLVRGYHELAQLDEHPAYRNPERGRDLVHPKARSALSALRAAFERKETERERAARRAGALLQATRPGGAIVAGVDDVATGPEARALQDAIVAAPLDDGPQLVLADLLVGAEDPRGELIVLHHRETTDGLRDPEALERYLLLAAVFSFPRAEPEEPPLPFVCTRAVPVQYTLTHGDRGEASSYYDVRYHGGLLEVRAGARVVLQRRLRLERNNAWTDVEAAVILGHLGEAIRAGAPLQYMQLPFGKDPLPTYDGGPVRSYRLPAEFMKQRGLRPSELGLAARDYQRWITLWRRLATVNAS
jgi:uncharacterized protein (TIGR02996 family)